MSKMIASDSVSEVGRKVLRGAHDGSCPYFYFIVAVKGWSVGKAGLTLSIVGVAALGIGAAGFSAGHRLRDGRRSNDNYGGSARRAE